MKPIDKRFGKDKSKDRTGERFGRLVVLSRTENPGTTKGRDAWWLCQCDCGRTSSVSTKTILTGTTKSCGCLSREVQRKNAPLLYLFRRKEKSEQRRRDTKEYRAWNHMKNRCNNPSTDKYQYYGGRGIKVCEQWQSFETFLQDMGQAPTPEHTLDRINPNDNYTPDNCRWATRQTQSRNRRDRKLIEYRGESKLLSDWAQELGFSIFTLSNRINRQKWSIKRAFETPVRQGDFRTKAQKLTTL